MGKIQKAQKDIVECPCRAGSQTVTFWCRRASLTADGPYVMYWMIVANVPMSLLCPFGHFGALNVPMSLALIYKGEGGT